MLDPFLDNFFTCKKFGHRAIECRSQMINRFNTSRMLKYFHVYYYKCNVFGHKANQCRSRLNKT